MLAVRQQFRQVRQILRKLKRDFPSNIVVYLLQSQTEDPATGVLEKVWKRVPIRRAVVLPAQETRSFVYDLSFIAANKNFTYGGLFDSANRRFLIDRDDMKGNELTQNDFITQNNVRWDVTLVDVSTEFRYISPVCKSIVGMQPSDTWPLSAGDTLELSDA